MKLPLFLCVLSCGALVSACGGETAAKETNEADANTLAEAAAPLPPSISVSRPYRCADGAVVYVDFLSDGRSAHARLDEKAAPVTLTAESANGPYTGAGFTIAANTPETQITISEKKAQTCKG